MVTTPPVWSDNRFEGPSTARLLGYAQDLFCDVCGLAEEVVFFVWKGLARPRQIDDGVYRHIGHVNPVRARFSSNAFKQYALRRLSRRKSGESGLTAIG